MGGFITCASFDHLCCRRKTFFCSLFFCVVAVVRCHSTQFLCVCVCVCVLKKENKMFTLSPPISLHPSSLFPFSLAPSLLPYQPFSKNFAGDDPSLNPLLPFVHRLPPVWIILVQNTQNFSSFKLESSLRAGGMSVFRGIIGKISPHVHWWLC